MGELDANSLTLYCTSHHIADDIVLEVKSARGRRIRVVRRRLAGCPSIRADGTATGGDGVGETTSDLGGYKKDDIWRLPAKPDTRRCGRA